MIQNKKLKVTTKKGITLRGSQKFRKKKTKKKKTKKKRRKATGKFL